MRRQFELPSDDVTFLNSLGRPWETIRDGGGQWVIVHNRALPSGYTQTSVVEALRVESGYPDTQLDMVYFWPAIARADGRPIAAVTSQMLDGKEWQRWSRHRTPQNPWRPGEDSVETHLLLVNHWLEKELGK